MLDACNDVVRGQREDESKRPILPSIGLHQPGYAQLSSNACCLGLECLAQLQSPHAATWQSKSIMAVPQHIEGLPGMAVHVDT